MKNIYKWLYENVGTSTVKAMPVMTYPGLAVTGKSVMEMISDGQSQLECIDSLCKMYNTIAAVTIMDLSVEAEAFGCEVRFSDQEVPTVIRSVVEDGADAEKLQIPAVGTKRTQAYIDAARLAAENITDIPVFAGCIGPISLAGRLMDVTNLFITCMDEPEVVHIVLEKATQFLIEYVRAFKEAGADGIVIAEPVAGLMSPDQCQEFSSVYVKKMVDALQDENFVVILHNCGQTVKLVNSMVSTGAKAFHFGNQIDMKDIMPQIPKDRIAFGNVDPAGLFRNGTPDMMKKEVGNLLENMKPYSNFILSSGCDIPPNTPLENIDAFFDALEEFNKANAAK